MQTSYNTSADGVALASVVRQVTNMDRLQQIYIRLIAGASLEEFRDFCTES